MVTTESPVFQKLRETGQKYLALYKEIEEMEAKVKVLKAQADELEKTMVEDLQEADDKVFHLDGVGRFQLDPQLFVSVLKEDKPIVLQWLKADPDGAALVMEDVNASRLKSFVKERLQQGKPLHELIKRTPMTQIKFVAAK